MTPRLAALLTCCLLAVSCTDAPPPTSVSHSEADVVAWLDQVCGVVNGVEQVTADEPPVDLTDPAALKTSLTTWLDADIAATEKSLTDLKAQENGPHADARELVGAATEPVSRTKTLLAEAKSQVQATADPTEMITVVAGLVSDIAVTGHLRADVRQKFTGSGLAGPWGRAPNCHSADAADSLSSPPTS